jgi:1-phosphatidylinositol-4-phosphate 5-kinase
VLFAGKFMVKTLEPSEYKGLKSLLPAYYKHMWNRRKSLLPRFYGAYSITIQNHEKHFVVMASVFKDAPNGKVHQCYDLKGSWIDRHAGIKAAHGGTYKDMDVHKPLRIEHASAEALLEELKHDSELLRSHGLMDYSLLLGVHNQEIATEGLPLRVRNAGDGVVASHVDVPGYYMGLIDILQAWNLSKRLERFAKILFKGRFAKDVRDGMSAVEPDLYRDRFLSSMAHQLGANDKHRDPPV